MQVKVNFSIKRMGGRCSILNSTGSEPYFLKYSIAELLATDDPKSNLKIRQKYFRTLLAMREVGSSMQKPEAEVFNLAEIQKLTSR